MNKKIIAVIIVVSLAIASATGVYIITNNDQSNNKTETSETQDIVEATSETIEYQGVEGKTALELLQSTATVEISGTGENAFVTSINGLDADQNSQYWAFYVNGELASVGAGSFITKDTDSIKWELTTF